MIFFALTTKKNPTGIELHEFLTYEIYVIEKKICPELYFNSVC